MNEKSLFFRKKSAWKDTLEVVRPPLYQKLHKSSNKRHFMLFFLVSFTPCNLFLIHLRKIKFTLHIFFLTPVNEYTLSASHIPCGIFFFLNFHSEIFFHYTRISDHFQDFADTAFPVQHSLKIKLNKVLGNSYPKLWMFFKHC